tara:strand:- start:3073 stop:10245 length:7173 start_codon:yes stop_codon:yes gene_type:complete
MEKLKALYESYIEQGLLSKETSFEQFSQSDPSIQEALYNQGVDKKIISSETTFDVFSSAWGEKKNQVVTPSDVVEEVTESTIETETSPGSLDSLKVVEENPNAVIDDSLDQYDYLQDDFDVLKNISSSSTEEGFETADMMRARMMRQNSVEINLDTKKKILSDFNISKAIENGIIDESLVDGALKGNKNAIKKLESLYRKSKQKYLNKINEKRLDKKYAYESNSDLVDLDSSPEGDFSPTLFEDTDVSRMYNVQSLRKIKGFNIKDFDGYLNEQGYKEEYLRLLDDETIAEDGRSIDYSGGYNPSLASERVKLQFLTNYINNQVERNVESQVLKYQLDNEGRHPSFDGVELSFSSGVDSKELTSYVEQSFPIITSKLKERDVKNQELYQDIKNGDVRGGSQAFKQGWRSVTDRINSFSAGVYDLVGADSMADEIRMNQAQIELEREDFMRYGYASGKESNVDGTNYLIDNNGQIYNTDLGLRVTNVLSPIEAKQIQTQVAKYGNKTSTFSATGTAIQGTGIVTDMLLQIALTKGVGTIGKGLSAGLSLTSVGSKAVGFMSKIPMKATTASAMVAQGTLFSTNLAEQSYRQALEAGLSINQAEEIQSIAGSQGLALGVITAPMSTQTVAMDKIFGKSAKNALVSGSLKAYQKAGAKGAKAYWAKARENASVYLKASRQEVIQENTQQVGQAYVIGENVNEFARKEIMANTISGDEFINTTILSAAAGFLMPFGGQLVSNAKTSYNKKFRPGEVAIDKMNALYNLSKDVEKTTQLLNSQVTKGLYTEEQVKKILADIDVYKNTINSIPTNLSPETALNVMRDIQEIKKQEELKKQLDPSFHGDIDVRIQNLRNNIIKKTNFDYLDGKAKIKLKEEAIEELTTEAKERGEKEFTIDNSQATYRAIENFNNLTQEEQLELAKIKKEDITASPEVEEEDIVIEDPSKGYSFEYELESDIPSQLESIEPISKSEIEVDGKKKIRLTFSGQQLIDAGLAIKTKKENDAISKPSTEKQVLPDASTSKEEGGDSKVGLQQVGEGDTQQVTTDTKVEKGDTKTDQASDTTTETDTEQLTDTTSETEVMSVNNELDNKIESFSNRIAESDSSTELSEEAQQFYSENQEAIDKRVSEIRKESPKDKSKTRRLATKIANGDTNYSNEQIDLYAANEAEVKAEVEAIAKTNNKTVTADTYKAILKSVKSTTRTDKAKQEGENAQRKRFWKSWNKSARLAKKDLKTKRKELNDQIKTYAKGKKGTISSAQTKAVINKVNSVNLDNELAVQELIDYSEKVFNDADFAVKEQLAIKLNKQVTTRLNKGNYGLSPDIVSRLTTILNTPIKQLTSENIDSYNDFLSNLKKQKENVRVDEQLVIDSQNMADSLYVEGNQDVDEEVETKKTKTLKSVVDKIINEDVDGETLISEDSKFIENDLDKLDSFTLQTLIDKINKAETDENQELVQAANDFAENRQKALTRIKSRSKGISLKSLDNTTKEAGDVDVFKNIKDSDLIGLTGKQLDLLEITLENINDGHYTHAANKLGQSINSRAYNMRPMIAKYGTLKNKVGMFRGRAAASVKSALKGSKSTPSLEIVRTNPLSVIDNAFGNFDNNTIRNNSFEPTATKYSAFKTFTGRLTDKLDAVEKIIAPTLKEGTNPAITRRFEITTYLLAKEYESNKGNDGVAEANAFIDKTIEKFNDVNSDSNYTQADIDILLAIKKKYSDNGVITSKKMDESLSPKVKKAIKLLEEVYGALGDKQAYATSIVRGNKLDLLNNYVHHKVDAANDKDDSQLLAQKTYFAPSTSTESKTSIGRTKGAKAIDFDPVSTALRGLRATGLDFFLTNEIQTSRKAFTQLTKLSQENNASEDVIEATQSLNKAYNEAIQNVLSSNFSTDVIGGKYFDMAKRVGYYSTLASVPRSVAELGSNLTFGLLDSPLQLMEGMTKYGNLSLMQNGLSFAENVGSTTVSKNWGSEILGGSKAEQGGVVRNKKPAKRASNSNLKSSLQYGKRATDTFGKGVELLADNLLSTPDKMISRPLFFGTFAKIFKQETGQDMDVDKISNNDQEYMTKYADAIKAAKIAADKKVTQAATSNDPFSGVLKNQLSDTDNGFMIYYKTINSYMSRFSINEFATARQAVASMIGQGEESAIKGGAKLAGVMTRMSLYVVMYKAFASMFNGMLGLDDEDETDYKELGIRQLAGAGVSLITRGASGNVPMIPINYGIELLNEEYGEQLGLWSDKDGKGYNSFKHSIIFSIINQQSLESKGFFKSAASVLAGPLSPQVMAAGRTAELLIAMKAGGTAGDKAAKKFFSERTAIEAAGIVGAMPFYKDLRRYFMAEDWSKIKEAKAAKESDKGLTYEELKIFNPRAAEKLKRDKKSVNKKYKSTSAYRRVKAMEDKLKKFK